MDQISSAEFSSKFSKLFWRWKLTSIGLIWNPTKLIESYEKMSIGGSKAEHFSCFHSSCQLGLMPVFVHEDRARLDFTSYDLLWMMTKQLKDLLALWQPVWESGCIYVKTKAKVIKKITISKQKCQTLPLKVNFPCQESSNLSRGLGAHFLTNRYSLYSNNTKIFVKHLNFG